VTREERAVRTLETATREKWAMPIRSPFRGATFAPLDKDVCAASCFGVNNALSFFAIESNYCAELVLKFATPIRVAAA